MTVSPYTVQKVPNTSRVTTFGHRPTILSIWLFRCKLMRTVRIRCKQSGTNMGTIPKNSAPIRAPFITHVWVGLRAFCRLKRWMFQRRRTSGKTLMGISDGNCPTEDPTWLRLLATRGPQGASSQIWLHMPANGRQSATCRD